MTRVTGRDESAAWITEAQRRAPWNYGMPFSLDIYTPTRRNNHTHTHTHDLSFQGTTSTYPSYRPPCAFWPIGLRPAGIFGSVLCET